MRHCRVDVACLYLNDWIRLQWVLRMKWASPIPAVRGSDSLFPNDFGEDLVTFHTRVENKNTLKSANQTNGGENPENYPFSLGHMDSQSHLSLMHP